MQEGEGKHEDARARARAQSCARADLRCAHGWAGKAELRPPSGLLRRARLRAAPPPRTVAERPWQRGPTGLGGVRGPTLVLPSAEAGVRSLLASLCEDRSQALRPPLCLEKLGALYVRSRSSVTNSSYPLWFRIIIVCLPALATYHFLSPFEGRGCLLPSFFFIIEFCFQNIYKVFHIHPCKFFLCIPNT